VAFCGDAVPSTMTKLPFGSRLEAASSSDAISVASFNLLAPLYIRPIDQRTGEIQPFAAFEWVKDYDLLRNETRLPRLLTCLENCGTDFICVQELQLERGTEDHNTPCKTNEKKSQPFILPAWIMPLLSKYQIILPSQQQLEKIAERNRRVLLADVAVTNGIFYKSNKWAPDSCNSRQSEVDDEHTTTCITHAFRSVNKDVASIVISSIHLDASREEKRCGQLQRCLGQAASFSSNPSHPYVLPLIIAGDFNCELSVGSCVSAFIANTSDDDNSNNSSSPKEEEEEVNKLRECAAALRIPLTSVSPDQEKQWHRLYEDVQTYVYDNCWVLKRVQTGFTRMALDHDELPSSTESSQLSLKPWKLDHFLYTSNTLEAVNYWATLEEDDESASTGLPNERVPTDHLPLAAIFKVLPHPQLNEGLRKQLLTSLEELELKQDADTRETNAEIDSEKINLEEKLKLKEQVKVEEAPKRKRKPHPEMIQHIRQSRVLKKQLKQTQIVERQQFVSGSSVLERMELQHALGMTCNEWIEKGRAK
jgi:endonuclease/exonuclease/phosphatase family metal-dependent hydrolase